MRKGDMRRNCSNTAKAKQLLGWQAQTELADRIQRTLQWYIDQLYNGGYFK